MLIDGHVHLHRAHPVEAALDAAVGNFASWGGPVGPAEAPEAMLWLVETPAEAASERLRGPEAGRWSVRERDDVTWELRRDDGARLVLIRGRQISTNEGLEVLLVGTAEAVPGGRSLAETIEPHLGGRVLVMLPWGFGKWTGRRGSVAARAYDAWAARGLRLADIGVRPWWRRTPELFDRSLADGRPVFVGSDPFPLRGTGNRIGSAGFVARDLRPEEVWWDMHASLHDPARPLERFGRTVGTLAFLRLQVRMQLRNRFGRIGR